MAQRPYKMAIALWEAGQELPTNLEEEVIHSGDEFKEMEDTFKHLINTKLDLKDRIIYMTHRWNFTFKREDASEYKLYMFKSVIF